MRSCLNRCAFLLASGAWLLIGSQAAFAQDFQLPAASMKAPGVAQKLSADNPLASAVPEAGSGGDLSRSKAMSLTLGEGAPRTRGLADVSLFRKVSASVVLVIAGDSWGSGSLISSDTVLTNYHVVGSNSEVAVAFKPTDPSGRPKDNEVLKGQVVKIDLKRDLALVKISGQAPYKVSPLSIASSTTVDIGDDVSAIGHPNGEVWSYTKGIVSQIRPGYEWNYEEGAKFVAKVIQTQTPISPGSSGGPLLSKDGTILGVNTFVSSAGQALNFAVAAEDINAFLSAPVDQDALRAAQCTAARVLFEGRTEENDADLVMVSTDCSDEPNIRIFLPDSKREAMFAFVDIKRRGQTEGVVLDPSRKGRWTESFWDPKLDGTFPLKGRHPDKKLFPASYFDRCGKGTVPVAGFKCSRKRR